MIKHIYLIVKDLKGKSAGAILLVHFQQPLCNFVQKFNKALPQLPHII